MTGAGSEPRSPEGARAVADALDRIGRLLRGEPPDGGALCRAFDDLQAARRGPIPAAELRQLLALSYCVLGVVPDPVFARLDDASVQVLSWRARLLVEETFHDSQAERRSSARRTLWRSLALDRPDEGGDLVVAALPHVPLDREEAEVMARPYLDALERRMQAEPYAHADLVWKVRHAPVPPFDRIFDDWLRDIDRRGIGPGDSHAGLDRAAGLAMLAQEGRQRMTWERCEAEVLSQIEADNLMVAGAAGRFLGVLLREAEELLQSAPPPLLRILERIAELPRGRRIVAGGFLQGFADGDGDPFAVLRAQPELAGFDFDDWVLRIFALKEDEPYLPSAMSFWFHVHEAYWDRADVVMRMIDSGHLWEAFMCATEAPGRASGMEPVLRRLALVADEEVAGGARAALERVFGQDPRPPAS